MTGCRYSGGDIATNREALKTGIDEFSGYIVDKWKLGQFRVRLDNNDEILSFLSGKLESSNVRPNIGDYVSVEIAKGDRSYGRISKVYKVGPNVLVRSN